MLDSLEDYLRDVYKETRYSHHTEWPPHQPKSVVSNTLVHYKDKRPERELLDLSKCERGTSSVDKIMLSHSSRVTKNIASIFESPDQKFILIEGAPGIGKTVLAKELSYRWAGHELLEGNKLFLLFCRNPNLHDVDSINQKLVSYFSQNYLNDNEIDVVVDELRKSRGQNLIFIIDGFDECPVHCQLKLFVEKLAKHEILPKAMVVITSRPHASILFHPLADKRIEILGFAKEEREKYIAESFKEFPDKIIELKRYLKLRPIINSVMHVPLHLAVLLYLFKEDVLPDTLTELNEQFVIHTIYRHLEKHHLFSHLHHNKSITVIKDLPQPVKKLLMQLSELAMKGLKERQMVFTYDEVKVLCTDIDDFPNGFGLLQAVHSHAVKGAGYTVSFNFFHLTMQEFLAAYYVSTLSSKEQSLLMALHYNVGDYVWLMFVGIVGIESDGFNWYQSTIKLFKSPPTRKLLLFQCYLEAKKIVQVPKSITFEDGNIDLLHAQIDLYTMVSLVNFIAKSCVHLRSLNLSSCSITDEKMTILQDFFTGHKKKIHNVKSVCLSKNSITSLWGVNYNDAVENSESGLLLASCLNLSSNELRDSGIVELFICLHHNTSLVQLDISNNGITSSGAIAISKCLRFNSCLQELDISQNELSDDGVIAISDSLKVNFTLNKLNIAENSITNNGALNIADTIAVNKTLSELNISINFITREGIMGILKSSTKTKALLKLDCLFNMLLQSDYVALVKYIRHENVILAFNSSWNKITENGIYYQPYVSIVMCYGDGHDLLTSEQDSHSVKSLHSSSNYFNEVIYCCIKDMKWLNFLGTRGVLDAPYLTMTAKAVKVNKVLTSLKIVNFIIGDNEVEAINDCLKANTLKRLGISYNEFNFGGLVNIIETVVYNTVLEELDISHNFLSSDDVESIGVCLKCTKALQELFMSHVEMADKGALVIAEAIRVNVTLLVLDISYSNMSSDDVEFIGTCLKYNKTLQELYMSHIEITDSGALMIAEAIRANATLLVLDISYSNISDVGLLTIGDSLKYNKQLQKLYIKFYKNITRKGLLNFAKFLKVNTTLVKLDMYSSQCKLKPVDIIDCLKSNSTLQQLKIGSCNWSNLLDVIDTEYVDWIMSSHNHNFSFLQHATINLHCDYNIIAHSIENFINVTEVVKYLISNEVLLTLSLQCCQFSVFKANINNEDKWLKLEPNSENEVKYESHFHAGYLGLIKMIESIKFSTTLQTLVIIDCGIQDAEATIVSDCLKHNTSIREVNLSWNFITSKGAVEIFKAIEVNSAIHKLNISTNNISDDASSAINECLNNNTTLQYLNICDNNIYHDANIDGLKNNTALQKFYMNVCFSCTNAHKLAAILKTNSSLHTLVVQSKGKHDTFPFVKVILSAMYDNSSVILLTLPFNKKEELDILKNEVELINIERQIKSISVINVIFNESANTNLLHRNDAGSNRETFITCTSAGIDDD